mgnify:CR=1
MPHQGEKETLIYQAKDRKTKQKVTLANKTVWLTQVQLVELFQSSKSNISKHIKHIFEGGKFGEKNTRSFSERFFA